MEIVVGGKFGVVDYWNRVEWQGRGSPHNHGFVWLKNAVELIDTDAGRRAFADFWGIHISALNPQQFRQMPPDENPLAIDNIEFDFNFMSSVINRVQIHACNRTYCLRKKKDSDVESCRFYFPHAVTDTPSLTRGLNPRFWKFLPVRNDPRLNAYNRAISMGWLANTDITPCTGIEVVKAYIAKYASKGEV